MRLNKYRLTMSPDSPLTPLSPWYPASPWTTEQELVCSLVRRLFACACMCVCVWGGGEGEGEGKRFLLKYSVQKYWEVKLINTGSNKTQFDYLVTIFTRWSNGTNGTGVALKNVSPLTVERVEQI